MTDGSTGRCDTWSVSIRFAARAGWHRFEDTLIDSRYIASSCLLLERTSRSQVDPSGDYAVTDPLRGMLAGEGGTEVAILAEVGFEFESLQYNLPATSLIIQSIPPSSPEPVTAEHECIAHLCETIVGSSNPYWSACFFVLRDDP